jgi:hypothetical protein
MLEGPAGAGKTEIAMSVARACRVPLLRWQCYQGINEEKAMFGSASKLSQQNMALIFPFSAKRRIVVTDTPPFGKLLKNVKLSIEPKMKSRPNARRTITATSARGLVSRFLLRSGIQNCFSTSF